MCCGMIEASLAFALKATAERSAFGSKTIEFMGVQLMLADDATDLSASELLFKAAASKLDRGERATIDAAHAKKFATKVALNAVAQCMQLVGARGSWPKHPSRVTSLAPRLPSTRMEQQRYRMLSSRGL